MTRDVAARGFPLLCGDASKKRNASRFAGGRGVFCRVGRRLPPTAWRRTFRCRTEYVPRQFDAVDGPVQARGMDHQRVFNLLLSLPGMEHIPLQLHSSRGERVLLCELAFVGTIWGNYLYLHWAFLAGKGAALAFYITDVLFWVAPGGWQ